MRIILWVISLLFVSCGIHQNKHVQQTKYILVDSIVYYGTSLGLGYNKNYISKDTNHGRSGEMLHNAIEPAKVIQCAVMGSYNKPSKIIKCDTIYMIPGVEF